MPSRSLSFSNINETIEFPFEKSDNLLDVNASMPRGWTYTIDQTTKKITVTSPKNGWNNETPHDVEAIFFARDADGNTYTRNLKLKLTTMIFFNYFVNDVLETPIYKPSTSYNTISFATNSRTVHVTRWHHLSNNGAWGTSNDAPLYYESGVVNDASVMEARFRQDVYRSFAKPQTMDEQTYSIVDMIYDPEYVTRGTIGDANEPSNNVLVNNKKTESANVIHMDPVPWDTYLSYNPITLGINSDKFTLRLKRVTQRVSLEMVEPKKFLKLADTEEFDITKLTLKIPTAMVMREGGEYTWTKRTITRVISSMTDHKGTHYMEYDAASKKLTASFATFLTGSMNNYCLLFEYTKQDGTVIRQRLGRQGIHAFANTMGGSILIFKYNVYNSSVNAYHTFGLFTPGQGTRTGGLSESASSSDVTAGIRPAHPNEIW